MGGICAVSQDAVKPLAAYRRRAAILGRQPHARPGAAQGFMGNGCRQRHRNGCVDGLARPWTSARVNAAGAVYGRSERAVTHLLRAMGNVPAVRRLWRVAVCSSPCPCGLTLVAADALTAALPPTRAAAKGRSRSTFGSTTRNLQPESDYYPHRVARPSAVLVILFK